MDICLFLSKNFEKSISNFSIDVCYAFFHIFLDFEAILASIWLQFWHHFPLFLHSFSGIDFASILYRLFFDFHVLRTTFSIIKQKVSNISAVFRNVWKLVDSDIHFGIIFDDFWHYFSIFFRRRFLHAFWDACFRILVENGCQKVAKRSARTKDREVFGCPGPFQKRFKNATSNFHRFWSPF